MLEQLRKKAASVIALADTFPDAALSRFGMDHRATYLFSEIVESITAIDRRVTTRPEAISALRSLSLEEFGYLLSQLPDARFPNLSRLLPSMPDADIQRHWCGRSGVALLKTTATFARLLAHNYTRVTGQMLSPESCVLDYGCGWGRLARLMYYFADESNLVGIDPWHKSIEACHSHCLGPNFIQSDFLPDTLPVEHRKFDLIYAYSVFTHLSEKAVIAGLRTLRKYIHDGGMLAITVRPVEYWEFTRYIPVTAATALAQEHRAGGFAFFPHTGGLDLSYGDSSMPLSWIEANCPEWRIALVDRTLSDRLQTYVYLTPK